MNEKHSHAKKQSSLAFFIPERHTGLLSACKEQPRIYHGLACRTRPVTHVHDA